MNTNDLKNDVKDDVTKAGNAVGLTAAEEPATSHDTKEGGIIGAVGGAVVGMLAGGPLGAVIGAVAGGAASAAAVNVLDKHDNDYDRTVGTAESTVDATTPTTDYETRDYGTNLAQNTSTLPANTMPTDTETVIPIVEEELAVGKRQVQSGGARIHTDVIETPVEETVNLREEHVTIDRYPVDRAVTDADTAFQDQSFEVVETAEVPVVAKTARVVEEVIVGKTATDRTETIRDTVRRTDVEVEDLGTNNSMNTTSGR